MNERSSRQTVEEKKNVQRSLKSTLFISIENRNTFECSENWLATIMCVRRWTHPRLFGKALKGRPATTQCHKRLLRGPWLWPESDRRTTTGCAFSSYALIRRMDVIWRLPYSAGGKRLSYAEQRTKTTYFLHSLTICLFIYNLLFIQEHSQAICAIGIIITLCNNDGNNSELILWNHTLSFSILDKFVCFLQRNVVVQEHH